MKPDGRKTGWQKMSPEARQARARKAAQARHARATAEQRRELGRELQRRRVY